jgi:hypothetical protein
VAVGVEEVKRQRFAGIRAVLVSRALNEVVMDVDDRGVWAIADSDPADAVRDEAELGQRPMGGGRAHDGVAVEDLLKAEAGNATATTGYGVLRKQAERIFERCGDRAASPARL